MSNATAEKTNWIAYNEKKRIYAFVSKSIAQLMRSNGNEYGFNRFASISDLAKLKSSLCRNGFSEIA